MTWQPADSPRMVRHASGWFVASTAHVSGDVRIGRDVSLWFAASVRGDVAGVIIGDGTNVQDNATIHCDAGISNVIGSNVTIGHNAIVHGREVGDGALVGMGATLLGGCVIGRESLVAAGALVPPNMRVPDRVLVAGVPARVVRDLTDDDLAYLRKLPPHYVRLAAAHADGEFPPGGRPHSGEPG